jgi:hypothetical protein
VSDQAKVTYYLVKTEVKADDILAGGLAALVIGFMCGWACHMMSDDHRVSQAAIQSYQARDYYYTKQADLVLIDPPAKENRK